MWSLQRPIARSVNAVYRSVALGLAPARHSTRIVAMSTNARSKLNTVCGQRKIKMVLEASGTAPQPGGVRGTASATVKLFIDPDNPSTFEGTGPNKKAAQEAAADAALQHLLGAASGPGLPAGKSFASPGSTENSTLTAVVAKALQASLREAALHAHHQQCKQYWDGWMPVSVLLQHSRHVRNAARRLGLPPNAPHSAVVQAVTDQLAKEQQEQPPTQQTQQEQQAAPDTACEPAREAPVTGDGGSAATTQPPQAPPQPRIQLQAYAVRLDPACHTSTDPPEVLHQGPTSATAAAPAQATAAAADQPMCSTTPDIPDTVTAILLGAPVPSTDAATANLEQVTEVQITSKVHLLGQISHSLTQSHAATAAAAAASVDAAPAACGQLVSFDAAGMKYTCVCWGRQGAGITDPPSLSDAMAVDSPPQSPRSVGKGTGAALCVEDHEPPIMYGLMPTVGGDGQVAPLNMLASWLAGQAVYGPVVLTSCRPRNKMENRKPAIRWAPFTATDLALALSALTQPARYGIVRMAPYLALLPSAYTTAAAWQGQPPKDLLAAYWERQLQWQCGGGAVAYERLGAEGVDAGGPRTQARTEDGEGEGESEGDIEVGESAGAVGVVKLSLPKSGLSRPAAPLLVTEPVARDNYAEWEASEQRAALHMLHLLHDADTAYVRYTLAPLFSAPVAAPESAGIAAMVTDAPVREGTGVPGDVEMEVGGGGVGGQQAGAVVVVHVGDTTRHTVRPWTVPSVRYQVWVYPPGVVPPSGQGPSSGQKRTREEEGEGGVGNEGAAGNGQVETGEQPLAHDTPVLVEQTRLPFAFQVGCSGVPVAVEEAVKQLHVGGTAMCRLQVAAAGPDTFGILPLTWAVVRMTLAHIGKPALAPSVPARPLFKPALAQQRSQLVLSICDQHQATRVCDLGAGDCALMTHLCNTEGWVSRLTEYTGLDLSASALNRGGRKVAALIGTEPPAPLPRVVATIVPQDPTPPVAALAAEPSGTTGGAVGVGGMERVWECEAGAGTPACQLLQGSVFQESLVDPGGWGDLHGVDLAACMEVVEHLDPAPLSLFGRCVLGGLQPKVLVVSTPNWEYNAVMRRADELARAETGAGAAAWPGPPGRDGLPLRCSDHRFEWTQPEFQQWASQVAVEHGYSVEFTGVGQVVLEGDAQQPDRDKGWSTQVAVFTRV